jgi:hypothetical protein
MATAAAARRRIHRKSRFAGASTSVARAQKARLEPGEALA